MKNKQKIILKFVYNRNGIKPFRLNNLIFACYYHTKIPVKEIKDFLLRSEYFKNSCRLFNNFEPIEQEPEWVAIKVDSAIGAARIKLLVE